MLKQGQLDLCRSLVLAGNKGPQGCSVTPPPAGLGRRMERKKTAELMGQDKGSLTEEQTK